MEAEETASDSSNDPYFAQQPCNFLYLNPSLFCVGLSLFAPSALFAKTPPPVLHGAFPMISPTFFIASLRLRTKGSNPFSQSPSFSSMSMKPQIAVGAPSIGGLLPSSPVTRVASSVSENCLLPHGSMPTKLSAVCQTSIAGSVASNVTNTSEEISCADAPRLRELLKTSRTVNKKLDAQVRSLYRENDVIRRSLEAVQRTLTSERESRSLKERISAEKLRKQEIEVDLEFQKEREENGKLRDKIRDLEQKVDDLQWLVSDSSNLPPAGSSFNMHPQNSGHFNLPSNSANSQPNANISPLVSCSSPSQSPSPEEGYGSEESHELSPAVTLREVISTISETNKLPQTFNAFDSFKNEYFNETGYDEVTDADDNDFIEFSDIPSSQEPIRIQFFKAAINIMVQLFQNHAGWETAHTELDELVAKYADLCTPELCSKSSFDSGHTGNTRSLMLNEEIDFQPDDQFFIKRHSSDNIGFQPEDGGLIGDLECIYVVIEAFCRIFEDRVRFKSDVNLGTLEIKEVVEKFFERFVEYENLLFKYRVTEGQILKTLEGVCCSPLYFEGRSNAKIARTKLHLPILMNFYGRELVNAHAIINWYDKLSEENIKSIHQRELLENETCIKFVNWLRHCDINDSDDDVADL